MTNTSNDFIKIDGLDAKINRIALGTWAIGGWMWGGADDNAAIKTIHAALDLGINLIDTAPVYGFGHSETVVGKALALSTNKDKAFVATKVGLSWDNGKVRRDSRPKSIREGVENSLKRLQLDVLPLVQVHWPDLETPIEETASELSKLQSEGKIQAIGVSNYTPAQMDIFRQAAKLSTTQDPLNMFESASAHTQLPYAKEHHMVLLGYGPLCRGLLTGKINENTTFKEGDLRRNDPKFKAPIFASYLKAIEQLSALAEKKGVKMIDLAIRWVLDQGPTIALWGARRPDQVEGVNGALGWSLTQEELSQIDQILKVSIAEPLEPVFMSPPTKREDGLTLSN